MSNEIKPGMVKVAKQVRPDRKLAQVRQKAARNSNPTALRSKTLKAIADHFALDKTEVKQLFGISESTQFPYDKQNLILKPAVADRLERFNRIYQQALELFENENRDATLALHAESSARRRNSLVGARH